VESVFLKIEAVNTHRDKPEVQEVVNVHTETSQRYRK